MEGVNRGDVHGLLPSLKRPAIVHFKGSTSVKRAHWGSPCESGVAEVVSLVAAGVEVPAHTR
jgi:hypothetical protein